MADPLAPFGWGDPWIARLAELGPAGAEPGRVVRHDGVAVLVATEKGTASMRFLPTAVPAPVVGDWVAVVGGAVVATLRRSSLLRRQDPAGGEQPLVANVDLLMIVCGLDRPVKQGRVQRSMALARDAGATPVVVLTKADVAADSEGALAAVEVANPGLEVLAVSVVAGEGIDAVRRRIGRATVVLLGESGAGKSTLVNALIGESVAATGRTRTGDARGRHTTTARQLHPLPGGGVLVDTPGIRSVGLWVDPDAVAATFDDIAGLAAGCRFTDCAHAAEPGCMVTTAVATGTLAPARVAAWRGLGEEAAEASRADELARRAYEHRVGRAVKDAADQKRYPRRST